MNLAIYPAGFAAIGTILLLYRFKLYSPWWLLLALFTGAGTAWATNALLLWIERRLENEKGAQP